MGKEIVAYFELPSQPGGTEGNHEKLRTGFRSPDWYSNPEPPGNEVGVLIPTLRSWMGKNSHFLRVRLAA